MSRIVITGLGAVTPIGNDVATFWENLKNGVSGTGRIMSFDPTGYHSQIACEVKNFNPHDYLSKKLARRTARPTQFALVATHQALADANFNITSDNASSVGVVINTGGGGISLMEESTLLLDKRGPRSIGPFYMPMIIANTTSSQVSIETGAMGPVLTSALACASGNYAFVEAYHLLKRGEADVIITGGVEGVLSPVIVAAFGRMRATSNYNDNPQGASRPFDAKRNGFVQGEGAAVMILEKEEHALARQARIYAEVLGGALTGDAYHITAPREDGKGAIQAMEKAIKYAGLSSNEVDVIYAHGTSTPINDSAETKAIKAVFGKRAYQIPVTATKSMIGHTLGAAGALSTLASVLGFAHGIIPPTINLEYPDPECDLDYVPHTARQQQTQVALINAFGFGGHNVVLALRKYNGSN
ncbi:MAG: beta-ketoacyl-[acyl-carrier-protein] synthase II [Anaerolineaceae bacterium 4572_78]|nr:MAG: beta-ketoacyl-[acyl-carrier-protein] synthase II [Anaerolineaceae bacterium 4572_78]